MTETMTGTTVEARTVSFDSDDPGDCGHCELPIYDRNDDCDCGHGDDAAMFALSDAYELVLDLLDEELARVGGEGTTCWEFSARNVGWTHSSSDGTIAVAKLEAAKVVDMLVHDRQVGTYRLEFDAGSTDAVTLRLWHHDAPFEPERFTLTPSTAPVDED